MARNYGPDKNKDLKEGFTKEIMIPRGNILEMMYSSRAEHENALLIYERIFASEPRPHNYISDRSLVERGNYSRSLSNIQLGPYNKDVYVVITGWHKRGIPNPELTWFQSEIKIYSDTNRRNYGGMGLLGFEDGEDGDYDDIRMSWKFV